MSNHIYLVLNPVKANIIKSPYDYQCSNAKAYKKRQDPKGLIKQINYKQYVQTGKRFKASTKTANKWQTHNRTGSPLGSEEFIKQAEKLLKRDDLMKRKPRPKVKEVSWTCVPIF